MPTLSEACRYIRTKNAGPFWITADLFFIDRCNYLAYAPRIYDMGDLIAQKLGTTSSALKIFHLPELLAVKISYPRRVSQGGAHERDMHGGQQYVSLLDLPLEPVAITDAV